MAALRAEPLRPRPPARAWAAGLAALALGGCVGVVEPTAPEVAAQAEALNGDFLALLPGLVAEGYEQIDLAAMGGPRLDGTATCIEKARGNALYGVDVVRVCGDAMGRVAGIWRMQTHSPEGWQPVL